MISTLMKSLVCLFALSLLMLLYSPSYAASGDRAQSIGGDFVLTDHFGNSFDSKQLRGKLMLIFFGYTYCPDICPTELSALASVLKALENDADKVTSLFISIDPERDTPEKLKQYVPFYSPDLIGLTGSPDDINKVVNAYHIQYKIHEHEEGDSNYLVDHSANLYVVGAEGELLQIIPFGLPVEHILNVVKAELDKLKTHKKDTEQS